MKLASPVTTVTPIAINTTALTAADLGKSMRHVGYGVSSFVNGQPQSDGQKRQVTTPLRQIEQSGLLIESGASNPTRQTCQGDSGGPGLMVTSGSSVERVIGVVAFGDQNCANDGWDTRVDAFANWAKSIYNVWEAPQCTEDGKCASGCSQPDIDCLCAADGQCTAACTKPQLDPDCPVDCAAGNVCALASCPIADPDCVADGSACTADYQCKGRRCVRDSQHPQAYCSRNCSVTTECPSGMECKLGVCNYPTKPEKAPYSPCNATTDFCAGGTICTSQTTTEQSACYYACTAIGSCVVPGEECFTGVNNTKYCRNPSAPVPTRQQKILVAAKLEAPVASGCSSTGGGAMLMVLAALVPLLRRRVV
jgi:uncharacterized protein (TIGR03382 family)